MPRPRTLSLAVALAASALSVPAVSETLAELYQAALDSNPAYRAQLLAVEEATAQKTVARSPLLPQLSATGSYSENEFDDALTGTRDYRGQRTVVQAQQALLDLTSYFRLRGADATLAQREQESEAARMELAGEVLERYLDVLLADDELAYLASEKDATQSQLEQLRFMVERQLRKQTDLLEIEAYVQTLRTREIEAQNARAVALEALHETTGVRVAEVSPLSTRSPPPMTHDEQHWLTQARESNRTLIALEHAIDAADRLLSSERSRHLPTVALRASYTDSDQGFDNRQLPPYETTAVSVQVTLPLFEGGRVSGSVREARARYNIARQQHEQAVRAVERGTRTAFLDAQASLARIESTGREVGALEKVVDSQRRGYDLGVTTVVDLLIAQRRLFRARSDHASARYGYLRDLTRLRIQAGSLAYSDIEEIAGYMNAGTDRDAN